MEFEDKARKIVEKECDDYFLGIVDLSLAKNAVIGQFKSLILEYPRAISIGVTIPYKITYEMLMSKASSIYKETNCQLKRITSHITSSLEKEGYKALSLPKGVINDEGSVSLHELVADLANLGHIEKNGMLVTREVGFAVNWGTVLTDAPIKETK